MIYQRQKLPAPPPLLDLDLFPNSVVRRWSIRLTRAPGWYGYSTTISHITVHTSYSRVVTQPYWKKAKQKEVQALQENHTWDIIPCSPSIRPTGCKWVYSVKFHFDGLLECYKARLLAFENHQEYGVDYGETFALVAKMTTVRTVLAVTTSKG